MEQGFIDILKKLIEEQGKDALINPQKCKALIADYTKNEYKRESNFLVQAIEAGVAKAIDGADELEPCKKAQIRELEEEQSLDSALAANIVNTLALVLRGDTSKAEIQNTNSESEDAQALFKKGQDAYNSKDYEEAFKYYSKAAEQGNADAQYHLGECYYNGQGVPEDEAKAVYWYTKAAEQGNTNAQYDLGRRYYWGNGGVPEDKVKAAYWSTKAAEQSTKVAEQGDADAQYHLGEHYGSYYGGLDEAKKVYWYTRAAEQYTKAAEQGDADAQYKLGYCYYGGNGVPKDEAKAAYWWTRAAEQGNADIQCELGGYYGNRFGVGWDDEKAVYWYTKAAEQGNADIQCKLGEYYENDSFVEQHNEKAVYWYTKAAEQGNANAQYYLGDCYYRGNGVPEDIVKAVYWCTKAAEQGNADAQCKLGECYYWGNGVPEDIVKAAFWYTKAAEQGDKAAQGKLTPLAQSYINRGMDYLEKGQLDYAISDFNEAIKLDPNNDFPYADRGIAYYMKDQCDQAISDLNEAIRLYPDDADAYATRGYAHCQKGQYDQAFSDTKKALEIDPNNNYARKLLQIIQGGDTTKTEIQNTYSTIKDAQAALERGKKHFKNKDYDQAIKEFTEAIRFDPNYTLAYVFRGDSYLDNHQYDQAASNFKRVLELDPNNKLAKARLQRIAKGDIETGYLENRQIRIFISSTFKDMQAERGYLVTKVFPALRRYCEERDVSIFELDLRWGISEEEAKRGKVFEICLDEVRNTKPFFIGLLGERYGWIPSKEERQAIKENTNVFKNYPWITDALDKGVSITEIEIQEGVLRAEEEMNAYFYFRSPKIEIDEDFREKTGSHEEEMLSQLKNTLHKQNVYPIKEYDSIETLGALVENDFKALVDSLFPNGALSPLEKERQQQRNFLKSRTRVYVPNPEWFAKLDEFVESEEEEKAIVIIGESGMGKSALIANWVAQRLEQKNKDENIIYHFIGASQSKGDYHKIIQRLIDEVCDIYSIPAKEREEVINLTKGGQLRNLLRHMPEDKKLIMAIDGIDRISDMESRMILSGDTPDERNIKIIYSTLPYDKSTHSSDSRSYRMLEINALSLESRKQLINDYLKSFGKGLIPAQVERIALDKENENPFILLTILDELRIFGVHEKIDGQIDRYLAAPDNESLFELVLQRIEETFSEGNAQKNLAKDILSLIAVSRNGLSETEILEISGTAPLYWSQLFNGMTGYLTSRNGFLSFSNSMIFNAAKKRYTSDNAAEETYRNRIAVYMETQSNVSFNRKCDELPYQLFELKEWDRLYNFLLDDKVFQYLYEKDKHEIGKYWRSLRETDDSRYTIEKYLELENTIKDSDDLLSFLEHIVILLLDILDDGSLGLKFAQRHLEINEKVHGKNNYSIRTSYDNIGQCYIKLGNYEKASEYHNKLRTIPSFDTMGDYIQIASYYYHSGAYTKAIEYYNEALQSSSFALESSIADISMRIGNCYSNLGDYEKALEYHNGCLAIRKKTLGQDNHDTALSYSNIGHCYYYIGDYENAIKYYNECLVIDEKVLGKDDLKLATSYSNISNCYYELSNYEKALEYDNEALSIKEKILGKDEPDTAASYNNIGKCYSKLSNYEKALEYHNEALAIRKKTLGQDSRDTALSYSNIGHCYYYIGDYENAIKYYNECLVIDEKVLGKDDTETAVSYSNIGNCYSELGNYEKAFQYHNEALAIREKVLGKNHSDTAASYSNISDCYYESGNYEKALEYDNEALSIKEKILGKDDPETAISYNNIGCSYSKLGDYEKAFQYHNEALAIREKVLGKNHPDTAVSYNKIGECYSNLNNIEKALENYKQALSIYNSLEGQESAADNIRQIIEQLTKQQRESNEENP